MSSVTQKVVSLKPVKSAKKRPRKVLTVRRRHMLRSVLAACGAGFLPVASYLIVHEQLPRTIGTLMPIALVGLTLAALAYSAPSMIDWARKWCGNQPKAVGFTVLLEGTMLASDIVPLNLAALALLVGINAAVAWDQAN